MRQVLSKVLLVFSFLTISVFVHAKTPTVENLRPETRRELRTVTRDLEQLFERAGTSPEATNHILDAILACIYEIKEDLIPPVLAKICIVQSITDGLLFTVVDTIENAQTSVGFTVCDKATTALEGLTFTVNEKIHNAFYSLAFTIVDKIENAQASLGFTICDKIAAFEDELKFTVCDEVGNALDSLGFTIIDKVSNAGIIDFTFTVCDKTEQVTASLAFTICDKTDLLQDDFASALEKLCSSLDKVEDQMLINLEELKFTICDKTDFLCKKFTCLPTPITQGDFDAVGGDLTLPGDVPSQSTNYCFAEDITGDTFTVNANDTAVDMNGRMFNGAVAIAADRVLLQNGSILTTTDNVAIAALCIDGSKNCVRNCIIRPADKPTTSSGSGLPAIELLGTVVEDNQILHCCVTGASGGDGQAGGCGIIDFGCRTQVSKCVITGGDGGTEGGAGQDGVFIDGNGHCYINNKIFGGNGGDATITTTGGDGGDGIEIGTTFGSADIIIHDCQIESGDGGNGSTDPGDGGHGVRILAGAVNIDVRKCCIGHTGLGGAGGPGGMPGRAIEDLVVTSTSSAGASVIFDNVAFDTADTAVRYNIHATGSEDGVDINTPPDNFDNVFIP